MKKTNSTNFSEKYNKAPEEKKEEYYFQCDVIRDCLTLIYLSLMITAVANCNCTNLN